MTKRKSSDSEFMPHKRAKLNRPNEAALNCQTLDFSTSQSTLLSPVRLQKRKRTTHLLSGSSKEPPSEAYSERTGPAAKRAKLCSSNSDPPVLWQSLEEQPRLEREEPHYDLTQAYFQQSQTNAMRFLDEYRQHERDSGYRNPLPSPDLSDDEAAQYATIQSFSVHATPPTLAIFQREATPPRKKKREYRRQSKNRAENALYTLEREQNFLRSKRSSRRDQGCNLWHLADDGKAYPVIHT